MCRLSSRSPNCVEICEARYVCLWRLLIECGVQYGIYTFTGYHLLVRHAVVLTLAPFALMGLVRWSGTNFVT